MKIIPRTQAGWHRLVTVLIALAMPLGAARADIRLPHLFSDHLVLQKSAKTAVWGWAAPDEAVAVALGTATAKTVAGPDGKWRVDLNLDDVGSGPFSLIVTGKNTVTVADVLVGQVWIASGQSNMELPLRDTFGAADEIAHSANPLLRQFLVRHNEKTVPVDDADGKWTLAEPEDSAAFSAAGYYFAKKLQHDLHVPVAIIHSSFGGTASEQWTSSEGLDPDPELRAAKDASIEHWAAFVEQSKQFPEALSQWLAQYHREDQAGAKAADFAAVDVPTEGWTPVSLPGTVSGAGLPPAGAYWLRKEVMFSPDMANPNDGRLWIEFDAGIFDFERVYWDGQKIAEVQPKNRNAPVGYTHRVYQIPKESLKAGKNVLAFRFFSPVQAPELKAVNKPRNNDLNLNSPALTGEWLVKAEYGFPAADAAAVAALPASPYAAYQAVNPKMYPLACQLFNGMIQPLTPATIAGVIWYQGESNVGRAFQYRTAFPLLIKDWRSRWGQGDFPFYYCQIANVGGRSTVLAPDSRAELRESQSLALALPNTGQAVLIDIGEPNIHPRDKKDAGERLALIALAKTYQRPVPFSGPTYLSKKVEGDSIRLSFSHADGGLAAKPLAEVAKIYYEQDPKMAPPLPTRPGSPLQGFAICGEDQRWVWADARIEGETVVVHSPDVAQPVAVRYAWAGNPVCNLYNGADLPASPFRTDDFPLSTADSRYGK